MKKRGNIATLKPQRAGEPSHNPHGRPKKDKCFGDIAREMMDSKEIEISLTLPSGVVKKIGIKSDKTIKQSIIAAMIREAMTGNLQAAKELIDRVDGKVTEKIDVKNSHGVVVFEEIRQPDVTIKPDPQSDSAPGPA